MKKSVLCAFLFFSLFCFSQDEQLAEYYYDRGDFEKAKINFEELCKKIPQNTDYFLKKIDCYQQLQEYSTAEKEIQARLAKYNQGSLWVILGYNFQLQKDQINANKNYDLALDRIRKNPNEIYAIPAAFEKKGLLEYALKAYDLGSELMGATNFNFQKGIIYGQQGDTDKMIAVFLDEASNNSQNPFQIQNQFARYMADDSNGSFTDSLRKALILRVQKSQDIFWNQFLSWFYVQQKDFSKAFIQEKAIYKRKPESLTKILNLIELAIEEEDEEAAKEMLGFVVENTKMISQLVRAHAYIIKLKIERAQEKDYPAIRAELDQLLTEFEINPFTIPLQIIQAHFLTFNLKEPEKGIAIVKKALELPINEYERAKLKMELAAILLYQEKFNQALIYYSQIELDLKNDAIAHEAGLNAARTSYFKTDFVWALKQFKELKSASTQLIANDALEYFLLINDNTVADSTQTALAAFARGDYLLFQNRNPEAIAQFQDVLKKFPGNEIEAVTLYRLGKAYEKLGNFDLALSQYKTIIDHHSDGIYIDEALYFSAEIYNKNRNEPEKAKPLYEKVLFNHEDSIYFVEARKSFRKLRGDTNL